MKGERIRHELHRRRATVTAVEDLSARLRRITIALEAGAAPVPHIPMAVGDHIKLAFPHPETGELHLDSGPVLRDYTVRAVAENGDVVVDVVLHGEGPASSWASTATIGSTLGVLGPRGSVIFPSDRARYLLLGDESAHPALSRWLEELPAQAEVLVVLETTDGTSAPLPERAPYPPAVRTPEQTQQCASDCVAANVQVVTGNDGRALVEALTAWQPRPGDGVWAAGEATAMIAVRNAAKQLGVPAEDLTVDGYWKHGVAGRDHHAPLDS